MFPIATFCPNVRQSTSSHYLMRFLVLELAGDPAVYQPA